MIYQLSSEMGTEALSSYPHLAPHYCQSVDFVTQSLLLYNAYMPWTWISLLGAVTPGLPNAHIWNVTGVFCLQVVILSDVYCLERLP